MPLLADKVAVITGGTRGLGLAIARAFAQEGAAVVVASRSAEAVERAVAVLAAEGARAAGRACDVSELAQVEALGEYAIATFGRFDIWVNDAGIAGPYGPTAHIAPEAFYRVVRTNIYGNYHGSLVALRHFLPRQTGKLINVLGWGARNPVPFQNAYASSKGWVRSFTLALAQEYRPSGVGIFAFNPGMMPTDLLLRVEAVAGYEERLKALPKVIAMLANPPAVPAQKVVWLASSATDGQTGLEVRLAGRAGMVSGLLGRLLGRLTGRQEPAVKLTVMTVPPAPPFSGL